MNISQHVFMPLEQMLENKGYISASGNFFSNDGYQTYGIVKYPSSPLVSHFFSFNDFSTTKLRSWNRYPVTSQSSKAYNNLYNTPVALTDDMVCYTATNKVDDFNVRLMFWYQDNPEVLNLNITPIDTELI